MSCNGCRVLRKGCREDCMLKQCLEWLDDAQAQANATVFVAKFYGRAGLMSSISSVSPRQRPSLFQSLLFEAVGRTVNPVSGAVGLLWTGNWHVCRTAVMTVLRGGTIESLPAFEGGALETEFDNVSEYCSFRPVDHGSASEAETPPRLKRKISRNDLTKRAPADDHSMYRPPSEESEMTTFGSTSPSDGHGGSQGGERKLLRLFV